LIFFQTEDDDVCEGLIALEGPIIARAIREMIPGSKTSRLFCVTFLGICPYPDITPYQVVFPAAKLSHGSSSSRRPSPSGRNPLKVVHFSDIHVDPFYTEGSSSNCTKPICCRAYTPAEEPGANDSPAGPNGDHRCDTPSGLEESMYAAIRAAAPDAEFALFTGDIVDHAIWNTTAAQNTLSVASAYGRMGATWRVFGTAGNHESSPTNAYPTARQGAAPVRWLYELLADTWRAWVGDEAAVNVGRLGAYSATYESPDSGGGRLRVISLNTNLYYIDNFWLYQEPMETDPSGQFAWLVDELDRAERAGEKAYILGHMPMGLSDAFHDASNYFDQIVNRYSETIAAMFFGGLILLLASLSVRGLRPLRGVKSPQAWDTNVTS